MADNDETRRLPNIDILAHLTIYWWRWTWCPYGAPATPFRWQVPEVATLTQYGPWTWRHNISPCLDNRHKNLCDESLLVLDHLTNDVILHLIPLLQPDRPVTGWNGHQMSYLISLDIVHLLNYTLFHNLCFSILAKVVDSLICRWSSIASYREAKQGYDASLRMLFMVQYVNTTLLSAF